MINQKETLNFFPQPVFKYKVDNFKAINDTVFKITLHQPYNPFLGILTMKY